ncbi:hypothetical protein Dimus_038461 [Dionaea muscipula]
MILLRLGKSCLPIFLNPLEESSLAWPGLTSHLQFLLKADDSMYKQRLKGDWLKKIDRSNKYFFTLVREKKRKHQITSLLRQDGTRAETKLEIETEILQYYHGLLGATVDLNVLLDNDCLGEGNLLNQLQKQALEAAFSVEDAC